MLWLPPPDGVKHVIAFFLQNYRMRAVLCFALSGGVQVQHNIRGCHIIFCLTENMWHLQKKDKNYRKAYYGLTACRALADLLEQRIKKSYESSIHLCDWWTSCWPKPICSTVWQTPDVTSLTPGCCGRRCSLVIMLTAALDTSRNNPSDWQLSRQHA